MTERGSSRKHFATFVAYGLTSTALASAWHLPVPSGIWLINALAAVLGITLGIWAISTQHQPLFRLTKRDLLIGVVVGICLIAGSQLVTRLVFLQFDVAKAELARLYALLETYPGARRAFPILMLVVLAEELVFRGAVTTWLGERYRPIVAIGLSTLLYLVPLMASGSWLLVLVGLSTGIVWTSARLWSQGLVVPLVSHALFSAATFVWLPIN